MRPAFEGECDMAGGRSADVGNAGDSFTATNSRSGQTGPDPQETAAALIFSPRSSRWFKKLREYPRLVDSGTERVQRPLHRCQMHRPRCTVPSRRAGQKACSLRHAAHDRLQVNPKAVEGVER
jgi:hypothetical protein